MEIIYAKAHGEILWQSSSERTDSILSPFPASLFFTHGFPALGEAGTWMMWELGTECRRRGETNEPVCEKVDAAVEGASIEVFSSSMGVKGESTSCSLCEM